ncbi:MAG: DUF2911 domain-containing protein [Cytophagales bacterium]|nr:DUF2911 domain-containing protein [Bernardetiaceae bacterium]MDW8203719.1 DUF2911 domain-containing protein [Cytophagales bacterium]
MHLPFSVCFFIMLMVVCACGSSEQRHQQPKVISFKVEPRDPIENPYAKDTIKGSPQRETSGRIGETVVAIRYHSPAVRGRIIWGGLVPYNQIWVTGAHNATAINFERAMKINGQLVKAGTYAIFTIPSTNEWTVIFNQRWNQHLTDEYNSKEDILRFKVQPQVMRDTIQRLTYQIKPLAPGKGEIVMMWETLRLAFPIEEAR